MVDSGYDRGASPPDDDSPHPEVEAGDSPAWSQLDLDATEQGRSDVPGPTKGVRVAPAVGAVAGIAALGATVGALRRRRARREAAIRAGRRRRAAGALGAGALSALLGAVRGRFGRRSR